MLISWIFAAWQEAENLGRGLAGLARLAARTARLMVGLRDYDAYLEHRRAFHRGEPVMSYAEFYRECQEATYALDRGGFRGIG